MDGAAPAYFDAAFFGKILQKSTDARVVVRNVHLQIATALGDNYTSEIYRAKIEFEANGQVRLLSLIIKNMPAVEMREEMLDNLQAYEREVEMYCQTLPALSQLLNNEVFSAKCLHATTDPCKMMIFQDLKDLDFALANRKVGLDLAHSRLVLRKIGEFHAASMVLGERQPEFMKLYQFGMLNVQRENRFLMHFFNESLKSLTSVVAKWPGYETIAGKLQSMESDFMKRFYEHVKTDNDTIRVLNHGDLWTNNIMFQYEGAEPKAVIFVDFQLSFYTTPGIDLNYFLWTSPANDVRVNYWTEMLQEYYTAFRASLIRLDATHVPSFENIQEELRRRYFYGFVASVAILPVILTERDAEQGSGMEALMDAEKSVKVREVAFSGQKYQEAMRYNLKRFDELGILD